jgi:hypothetical protein
MAFSIQELYRVKRELGYNLLTAGADVYVGVTALFDTVIQTYIDAEVATTSATVVTTSSSPSPAALTLTLATGFAVGQRCVIDVDSRQEVATLSDLSGSVATFLLSLAHSGTYSVVVEGPITMARACLNKIDAAREGIGTSFGYGALKKADEIEFYDTRGKFFGSVGEQLDFWRSELASILGVPNAWELKTSPGGCQTLSVY